ncbi:MAG: gliding motility-associated ABC transporter substrate-binding protein GldG [Bacteroidales bacterium]|jgi:ABC-2 type transport system permease protein|nr:gliding motility-associated ABC transporter substrate-binding protein GldG [Bacteroidales bacterium]
MEKQQIIRQHLFQYLLLVVVIFVLALASSKLFFRVDLTSEKRYTLASSTKDILRELEAPVYFRVYLAGDLPPDFVKFQITIREMLDEFRAYAGENIQYDFINLYEEKDATIRERTIYNLYSKGLRVTSIKMKDAEGGSSDKTIFPGAVINFQGLEFPVNLLKNNPALPPEVNLSNSIQSLEYEFSRALHSLTVTDVPKIAFIEGHGELDSLQTYSIMNELKNFFQVDRGYINGNLEAILDYEALIIAQPMRPFPEVDKFVIDQYIMRGGKVLWLLDPVITLPDSLENGMTISLANQLGIEDLLFKYGFRLDYNIVTDLQCNYVPVNISVEAEQGDTELRPWVYNPLLSAPPTHPITRGLNVVYGQFVSTFDTLAGLGDDLKRTVLLSTSESSQNRRVPLRITMDEVSRDPNPNLFTDSNLPVAAVAEGTFTSFYQNYSVPKGVYPANTEIIKKSKKTSMLLVTDGDIIRNDVAFQGGRYAASVLGYDKYTYQTFGNLEFIMNAVNYMTDDTGLMELRSREFKLRLLNKSILTDKAAVSKWKLINSVLPLVIIILFGLGFTYYRKKKYSS